MSLSRNQITSWMKGINIEGKACVDLGAGPKEKWACHFTKGKPKQYTTFDADPAFAEHNIDLNYPLVNQKLPFDLLKNNQVAFCIECLEHTWNPVQAVKNLSDLTSEVCYITVPFINPIHSTWDFLRFTDEWFEKVLPTVGFNDIKIKYRMATKGLETLKKFYIEEGLRMSKIRLQKNEGHKMGLIGIIVEAYK